MSLATQAYAFGNCTYYVATRYPNIYPYLGNALNWIVSAKKQGYTVLSQPAPDTVVVYGPGNGYSSLGHVAVVESVNSDGSFQVSEMNYRGYDLVDQRKSTMKGVIGFIVPPGSTYQTSAQTFGASLNSAASSQNCATSSIDFPGIAGQGATTICFDGLIGTLAMAGGALLMLAGVAVFVAFALNKSGLADKLPLLGGPVGAAAAVAKSTSAPKPKPVQPSQAEAKAASEVRVSRAKARLSLDTERQVEAARYGKGTKLTPEAKEELRRQAA